MTTIKDRMTSPPGIIAEGAAAAVVLGAGVAVLLWKGKRLPSRIEQMRPSFRARHREEAARHYPPSSSVPGSRVLSTRAWRYSAMRRLHAIR
jgi:hypothetical protein